MKEITWDILQSVYTYIFSCLLLENDSIVFFDLQCHVLLLSASAPHIHINHGSSFM